MTAWPWRIAGVTKTRYRSSPPAGGGTVTPVIVRGLAPAVTVTAEAGVRLDRSTFSENRSWISCPVSLTTALVSVGAVVSPAALTTMSKVSLTEALPSLAVTFTETVATSAVWGVPEKVRVLVLKLSHEGNAVPSACVTV